MPLEAISPRRALVAELIAPQWRTPLLQLSLACAALLALFAPDWAAMAQQWWNSSTYNHALLVPAILAWLVWQRAGELKRLTPVPWWPGLLALAGALIVWLLGDISGLATASQLGVVMMLQAATLTVLGPRVVWALTFPIVYALFLVPIGDEFVPALQMITAKITIALTEMSGIPAHIEGVFIDTPAGLFEVAEACSGVKFLIAMIALGTLVAHVCFRSWWRRAGFMALAIVLPVLANGVRAWGTIYIAQSQGIGFAAGFDHIFYGWVFFALVMAALMGIGWKFFDRSVAEPFIDGDAIKRASLFSRFERAGFNGWHALGLAIGLGLVASAWAHRSQALEAELADTIALPQVDGWEQVATSPDYGWEPRASGADRRLTGSYRNSRGQVVDIVYALYAAQGEGREAGAFGEGALPPDSEWRWLSASTAPDGVPGERMQALGSYRRTAETWYRAGKWIGTGKLQLKLVTMRDRLFLVENPTAMLILSVQENSGDDAAQVIAQFRQSTGDLGEWMDRAGRLD